MFTSLRGCGSAMALTAGTLMLQAPALATTFNGVNPVSDHTLDHIRGGFSVGYDYGQLRLALDISQANLVNGIIGQARKLTDASGAPMNVMQYGPNNAASQSALNNMSNATLGTVIQNSMNNQIINTVTTINITITSQALAQAMTMQSLTQGALLQFLH